LAVKRILIAAVSARPFAETAKLSGYEAITLDIFADQDTRQASSQSFAVAYHDGGFDSVSFIETLSRLDLADCIGAVYGSGFEQRTALLEVLADKLPLIGNSAGTVLKVKCPQQFFGLLDKLDISYPETRFKPPADMGGWLRKCAGGSGGTHITASASVKQCDAEYYQKSVTGKPVSLLFAADGKRIREIGFNLQHYVRLGEFPYCYAGAVSYWRLDDSVKARIMDIAARLIAETGLVGLNSLDMMIDGRQINVLEVNPRLTATVGLYQPLIGSMLDIHLRSVHGNLDDWPAFAQVSTAHRVVYADEDIELPGDFAWPAWVKDIPGSKRFVMHAPVCSVFAEADDPEIAIALADARVQEIKRNLKMEEGRLK
jgi:predicted ATP-grasp superfamily ATP-dependent carboligase